MVKYVDGLCLLITCYRASTARISIINPTSNSLNSEEEDEANVFCELRLAIIERKECDDSTSSSQQEDSVLRIDGGKLRTFNISQYLRGILPFFESWILLINSLNTRIYSNLPLGDCGTCTDRR